MSEPYFRPLLSTLPRAGVRGGVSDRNHESRYYSGTNFTMNTFMNSVNFEILSKPKGPKIKDLLDQKSGHSRSYSSRLFITNLYSILFHLLETELRNESELRCKRKTQKKRKVSPLPFSAKTSRFFDLTVNRTLNLSKLGFYERVIDPLGHGCGEQRLFVYEHVMRISPFIY